MKQFILLLLLTGTLTLVSCVTQKTYTDEQMKMRFGPEQAFVIKADGEKVSGTKISTRSDFIYNSIGWIKLDGRKYEFDELTNFQDRHAYYVKFRDRWIKQLKRGKINLFYYETVTVSRNMASQGHYQTDVHQHFVIQKGDGSLEEPSIEGMSLFFSDNREAIDKFIAAFKPGRVFLPKELEKNPQKLFEVVDLYNNS